MISYTNDPGASGKVLRPNQLTKAVREKIQSLGGELWVDYNLSECAIGRFNRVTGMTYFEMLAAELADLNK